MKLNKLSNAKLPSAFACGKVGIFWVFHEKLLAATWALQAGEEYGDAINGLADHVNFWPQFQKQNPELKKLDYQEVPRGRVLFSKTSQKFHIFMDKVLHKPKIKRAILKKFELPAAKTKFLTDSHYTTNPEELNRLFS
jgi:hypothetical protein